MSSADLRLGPVRPDRIEIGWIKKFQDYLKGRATDFGEFQIAIEGLSPFQQKVVQRCRKIPHGKTLTYGQLARQVGSPGAARAVGSVMRKNEFPLVVPCHRVVAATGLGGYSASNGVATKRKLLFLEGVDIEALA